ncbi:MAG: hypothetical protein ACLUEQ_10175 [Cloacibacillus evryensis]
MQEILPIPGSATNMSRRGGGYEEMLELSMPPAPDESRLRSTLVPGLLKAVATNIRYFTFPHFEMTQVFLTEL